MEQAYITVDLGYGDSGKGTVVDVLAHKTHAGLVVRYNGGCQAGHNVVVDGTHFCFSQYGSGTFAGAKTLLSRYMVVNPILLAKEAQRLADKGITFLEDVLVDERALVTTPYHRALNRLRERSRGANIHGSCGLGVGETVTFAARQEDGTLLLRAGDIAYPGRALSKLELLWCYCRSSAAELPLDLNDAVVKRELSTFEVEPVTILEKMQQWRAKVLEPAQVCEQLEREKAVIFEGAQGALLDGNYGFHPYSTWSNTTTRNAHAILAEAECRCPCATYGITRVYATRHGPGPLVTEDQALTHDFPDEYNPTNAWQQSFRCGWPDMLAMNYALSFVGKIDFLALTHVDALANRVEWKVAVRYAGYDNPIFDQGLANDGELTMELAKAKPVYKHVKPMEVPRFFEVWAQKPIALRSYGPSRDDKIIVDYHHA